MKTSVLLIVLFALSGLVNAIQPTIPPVVDSPKQINTIKKAPNRGFNSYVPEQISSRLSNSMPASSTTVTKLQTGLPEYAPLPICNVNDSLALLDLYNETNGGNWTNEWNLSTRVAGVDGWKGIYLNPAGRVEQITLADNNLAGTIPSSIGDLSALTYLDFSNNSLSGTVPAEIGGLSLLGSLYLSDNQLTGTIPSSIGNLVNLYELYLSNNMFSGEFPPEIGEIPYLMYLYLSTNEFEGNILSNLTTQTYLTKIDISYNKFSGTVPVEIGEYEFLDEFYINNNQFIFSDIESIFDWTYFGNFVFRYNDQAEVGAIDTLNIDLGNSFHLGISGYVPGVYDVYQWYRSDTLQVDETDTIVDVLASTMRNAGRYFCEITNTLAEDLTLRSKNIQVNIINHLPVANAGPDQLVDEGVEVTLDGSLSSDPELSSLTYSWASPADITLSDSTVSGPTFIAPEVMQDTTYIFILTVNDGIDDSPADSVEITVKQVNKPPVADAGPDQIIDEGSEVTLDGSGSSDIDNDPLSYQWTAPVGITLSDETAESPTFTAFEVDEDTTLTFVLVVSSIGFDSEPDTVLINVSQVNKLPTALAGNDQIVDEGDLVTLDGSGNDPDRDRISYLWIPPDGITLSDDTDPKATFTAPEVSKDTTYLFELLVYDGTDYSDPDTVLVTVQNIEAAVPETLTVNNTTIETGITACFDALQTITVAANGNPVVFGSGSIVDLIAGHNIRFLPGFYANSGSHVHALISISFCTPPGAPEQPVLSEKSAVIGGEISYKNPAGVEKRVKIFPNPNDGRFTIELSNFDSPAQLTIFNSLGAVVLNKTSNFVGSSTLDISYLNRGLYFVKVKSDNYVQTHKIIIN
jgi:hypothetical protein